MSSIKHIIKGCKNREEKAQQLLYSLYVDKLYFVVCRYVNDTFYIQNILQDVFIKIFNHIDSYDESKASFLTWAKTIAVRESINHCKKRNINFTPIDSIDNSILYVSATLALSKLAVEDLLNIIAKIPIKYRTIFNLYEIDGYSHDEIAQLLQITASTSRSYLTRAKKMVQEEINRINAIDLRKDG